jgi:hypothetical protein
MKWCTMSSNYTCMSVLTICCYLTVLVSNETTKELQNAFSTFSNKTNSPYKYVSCQLQVLAAFTKNPFVNILKYWTTKSWI